MKNNRGRFDITCVGGDVIYAVAGSNGQAEIASVEKYDPKVGKWTKSASLPVNLSNIGNKFGGKEATRTLSYLGLNIPLRGPTIASWIHADLGFFVEFKTCAKFSPIGDGMRLPFVDKNKNETTFVV